MKRNKYVLHEYNSCLSARFSTKKAFCSYVRALPVPAADIAARYFLCVVCPDGSTAAYRLEAFGFKNSRLRAVRDYVSRRGN